MDDHYANISTLPYLKFFPIKKLKKKKEVKRESLESCGACTYLPLSQWPGGGFWVPMQPYGVHAAGTAPGRAVAADDGFGGVLMLWRGCEPPGSLASG